MKQFDAKLRLIIVPFLIISITTNCIYSFLHWWLLIANELFVVDEPIVNFACPLIASFVPILIWLRPRVALLDFTGKKIKNPVTGYLFLAWIAALIPLITAQEYLTTATGKLTKLTFISQISNHPKTKYYMLKNVYVDKQQTRPNTIISTSGKYNTNYDMALYMPCPIFDSKHAQLTLDTVKPLAWLAIKYQKTIKNSLGAVDKDRAFNFFIKESQADFDKRNLENFTFLNRIGPSNELRKYANGITFSRSYKTPFIILVPNWGRYEDRNGDKLSWLLGFFAIGLLVFTLLIAVIPLKSGIESDPRGYQIKE